MLTAFIPGTCSCSPKRLIHTTLTTLLSSFPTSHTPVIILSHLLTVRKPPFAPALQPRPPFPMEKRTPPSPVATFR